MGAFANNRIALYQNHKNKKDGVDQPTTSYVNFWSKYEKQTSVTKNALRNTGQFSKLTLGAFGQFE